jgi:hypothetical protein
MLDSTLPSGTHRMLGTMITNMLFFCSMLLASGMIRDSIIGRR